MFLAFYLHKFAYNYQDGLLVIKLIYNPNNTTEQFISNSSHMYFLYFHNLKIDSLQKHVKEPKGKSTIFDILLKR